ncbi:hypothetical protein [Rhodopirellula sallentina]|nr:hypothetical protein [Rhodopirellula sallentina]
MSIHYRIATILAVIALTSGLNTPHGQAQSQYTTNAQLASCGTPACGAPNCGGTNCGGTTYSSTPYQTSYGSYAAEGYSTMPYGGGTSCYGATGDTSSLYESGYTAQAMAGGTATSGTGITYSDGYSVAGPSSAGMYSSSAGACGNGGMMAGGGSIGGGGMGGAVIGGGYATGGGAVYGDPCGNAQVATMPTFGSGTFGNFAPGFYGGFEFLWLRANFGQNVALIIDPPVGNTLVPFEYDNDLSPRAWLGWQSCRGTGFRFTYFSFDNEPDPVSVTAVTGATPVFVHVFGAGANLTRNANANVGSTLTSHHELKMQAYDIEATQQFCFASTQAMFGLGVRIAEIEQLLRGDVYDGGGVYEEAVRNDLKFQGAGPTASLWLTRQIMCSRFSFYSNLRGAFLIGDTDQRIYEMKGAYTTELEDRAIHREILTNAECSVGLQFGQSLTPRCGCFLRVGYEAQIWLDAGGPVNSDSSIGLDGVTFATGLAL